MDKHEYQVTRLKIIGGMCIVVAFSAGLLTGFILGGM